jgi:hypothetical protein
MPATNTLLNDIVTDLRNRFPELKTCEVRDGGIDPEELARVAARTPAMFVSVVAIPTVESVGTEQTDALMELSIDVVTKSAPQLPRGAAARNLVDALLGLLPNARWGMTGVGEVSAVTAENHYSKILDGAGVALWSVTWRQVNRLGTDIWDVSGVMPTELYVGLEPELGPDHVIDYDLVS